MSPYGKFGERGQESPPRTVEPAITKEKN